MQDNSTIAGARQRRSRATTDGLDRAPHRAFPRAMGLAVMCRRLGAVTHSGKVNWPYRLHP